jgi:uncharacterized membrane protein
MAILMMIIGAAIFIGIHLVPAKSGLRDHLVRRLSENGYKMLFTAISVAGLGLLIYGKAKAGHTYLWLTPGWGRSIAPVIMLPSMILLAAAKLPTNIKRFTPHPMLWGFILWSVAHLLANGDLASIILFGSIGAYSVIAIVSANQRGASTSTVVVPVAREAIVIGVGIIVYITFVLLHGRLFGAPLI